MTRVIVKRLTIGGAALFAAGATLDFLGFPFTLWFPPAILGAAGLLALPCYWLLRG